MGITHSGMALTTTFLASTCLLMLCIGASPVCQTSLLYNQVGLCSPNGSVEIWDCASCPPRFGQSVECGHTYKEGTKVGCEPCASGTFSETYDISVCKKCKRCQKNEVKMGRCRSHKDSIICTCKSGYYRDAVRDCKPCSWCCGDKTINEFKPECNVEQVPPGKRCSFTLKSCAPSTVAPTTVAPTTDAPTTDAPTTAAPTTDAPTTDGPTTAAPTTAAAATTSTKPPTSGTSSSSSSERIIEKNTMTKGPSEGKSGHKESWFKSRLSWLTISVIICLVCIFLFFLFSCWFCKRRKALDLLLSECNRCRAVRSPPTTNPELELFIRTPSTAVQGSEGNSEQSQEFEDGQTGSLKRELIHSTFGPKVENMPHNVTHQVGLMLNPIQRIEGNDYRSVADKIRLEYHEKNNLPLQGNPMKDIFEAMIARGKEVDEFVNILFEIGRDDVVKKMYRMALNCNT